MKKDNLYSEDRSFSKENESLKKEMAFQKRRIEILKQKIDCYKLQIDKLEKTIDDLRKELCNQSEMQKENKEPKECPNYPEKKKNWEVDKFFELQNKIEELETTRMDIPTLKKRGWKKGKSWKFDFFLSYSHLDGNKAITVANALEEVGLIVWWDKKNLRTGERFDNYIKWALEDAFKVIVLWSKNAANSDYVLSEAKFAHKHDKLMPVLVDNTKLPSFLSSRHITDLSRWNGALSYPGFLNLIEDASFYTSFVNV